MTNDAKILETIKKVPILMKEMYKKQIDREELTKLLVLHLFSLKHIFLLGEPGVSKTGILNILMTAVKTDKIFQITLKNDTKYEELFGEKYRDENGKQLFETRNTIIEAHMVFLDETWKGNSKIMNSLLSAMSNYRVVDIQGMGQISIPLLMVSGASNELPSDREVRALRDRFTSSYIVKKIQSDEDWLKYISRDYDRDPKVKTIFTVEEIHNLNKMALEFVSVPEYINHKLLMIRTDVIKQKLGVSERKFDGAIDVFLVSAFINNRKEVDISELFFLLYMLWDIETDIEQVDEIIFRNVFNTYSTVEDAINRNESFFKKLVSQKEHQLGDFLKFRKPYSNETKNEFDNYQEQLNILIEHFFTLDTNIESIINHYNESMLSENMIADNMFLTNYKSPVYQKIDIHRIFHMKEQIANDKYYLINWEKKYSEMFNYNENVKKVL